MGRHVVGYNRNRPSKLIDAEHETRDDADILGGYWTREQLIKMDERFCRAMRKEHSERENMSRAETSFAA